MEIKVSDESYNPLLKRKEINLEIEHRGEGTPQRFDIRKRMASKLGAKIENVYVVALRTSTGLQKTFCSLQIYDDPKMALWIVPEHIAVRNLPAEERTKVKEAKSAKVEKRAAKPAEKEEPKPPKQVEAKPSVKTEAKPEAEPAKTTKPTK